MVEEAEIILSYSPVFSMLKVFFMLDFGLIYNAECCQ